jgi:hypothetical protein
MKSRGRLIARLLLLAGLFVTAGPAPAGRSVPSHSPIAVPGAVAETDVLPHPEVRLRKLHLVRPDLIPYPIDYEVVC